MAKIPVKIQKIFASALAPAGNVAQAGSTVGGVPVYSSDPAVLQGLAAWANGIQAQLINAPGGLSSPVLEELNGILLTLSYQIAYLKQQGIAEWDPTVTYFTGSWALSAAGVPYVSKTDNNTNNILTDATNWQTFASTLLGASAPLLKAWVTFDGRTGAIDASFNVSGVARLSAGIYLVTFTAAMADAFYGFSGSAGTRNGFAFINGDDNIICGGAPGHATIRTAAQCQIFCYDRPNQASEDSSQISLSFFGN